MTIASNMLRILCFTYFNININVLTVLNYSSKERFINSLLTHDQKWIYAKQQKIYIHRLSLFKFTPLFCSIFLASIFNKMETKWFECFSGCYSGRKLLNHPWNSQRSSLVFLPTSPLAGNRRSLPPISKLTHPSVLSEPPECYPTYKPLCSSACCKCSACEGGASCWFYSPPFE